MTISFGAFLALSLVCLASAGCSKKAAKKDDVKEPKKEAPDDPKRLYTGAGEATVRDPEADRKILYVIRWEKTQLDYTLDQGASTGRLENVSGDLYRDGKLVSKFTANLANADRTKKVLILQGRVIVTGIDPKARLTCQRLEWKTDKELLKVLGRVKLEFARDNSKDEYDGGVIGPMDEMWCLPDLKKAGTPGFYP